MSVFGSYSKYYDLLYRDKDYAGEAAYVHGLIQRHAPGAKSILELGSGTGKHAILLAEKGYRVTGVDQSEGMVAQATERARETGCAEVAFSAGDIRDVRVDGRFDAVISLFHVVSYLPTNEDLASAFATAARHVKPGGVFVFDCWYGPAVLTEKPVVRVKRLEDDSVRVVRIAEPRLHPNECTVDVNYTVFVQDKPSGAWDVITETHAMRYLFAPELARMLHDAGFTLERTEEWLSGAEASERSWGVVFVGRKA
jgi:SAM-dependent methyltransferase